MWLALMLLALLATLPFITEENAERAFNILLATAPLVFGLILVTIIIFPRGLRLPLGRWDVRIAPPAAYFMTYRSASRWLDDVRIAFVKIADELDAIKGEQDKSTAELLFLSAKIADEIGLDSNAVAKLTTDMFFRTYTNTDAVLGAALAAAIDALREKLAQPAAPTTVGILDQVSALERAVGAATALVRARLAASQTFVDGGFHQVLDMAQTTLTELLTTVEQRTLAAIEQSFASKVAPVGALVRLTPIDTSAALADIEAKIAEVTQPGRPADKEWSDAEIRDLHAAYLVRGEQTSIAFAKRNNLSEGQMFKLFRRVGITKKGGGEFGQ